MKRIMLTLCMAAYCFLQGSLYAQKSDFFVPLVSNHESSYRIILPADPSANEKKAAAALQDDINRSTGALLRIISENDLKQNKPGQGTSGNRAGDIYIGATAAAEANGLLLDKSAESFRITLLKNNLFFTAGQGHAIQYAALHFAEQYLGASKLDQSAAAYPPLESLRLPGNLNYFSSPAFNYRESYYPLSEDGSYLNWHALQRFDDLWGLWGHSYFKLLPPQVYFKQHPEYYALIHGKRTPTQLCLSSATVLKKVIDTLKVMMADNPDAEYWSIAPNDDGGYCTCDLCQKADQAEGGHQGSLIQFVNKVAAAFPEKKITTLAYQGTAEAPLHTRAAKNVVIMLSSIDVFRDSPIRTAQGGAAEAFRRQLTDWSKMADQVFIWDYSVQFTNYLSPFPDLRVLRDNLNYFRQNGVSGVFEQGSGPAYSDASELNSFVQAKLLWNPKCDLDSLIKVFCEGYYGKAADQVQRYFTALEDALKASGRHLDIYGNPIIDSRGYLSRANISGYAKILQKAEEAVKGESVYEQHLQKLSLGLKYVQLQQSLFYGLDSGGFLTGGPDNDYLIIKPGWAAQVDAFVQHAKAAEVTELSEGGLSPDQYGQYWQEILKRKWPRNIALGADVTLKNPFVEDYPAKGKQTLTDGMIGFNDFSFNWLCFYGTNLEATLDLGQIRDAGKVSIRFLDDPRHWIFSPDLVTLSISEDGLHFQDLKTIDMAPEPEHMDIKIIPVHFTLAPHTKIRYIKVLATCPASLPDWRAGTSKKPMIAADEIMVSL